MTVLLFATERPSAKVTNSLGNLKVTNLGRKLTIINPKVQQIHHFLTAEGVAFSPIISIRARRIRASRLRIAPRQQEQAEGTRPKPSGERQWGKPFLFFLGQSFDNQIAPATSGLSGDHDPGLQPLLAFPAHTASRHSGKRNNSRTSCECPRTEANRKFGGATSEVEVRRGHARTRLTARRQVVSFKIDEDNSMHATCCCKSPTAYRGRVVPRPP